MARVYIAPTYAYVKHVAGSEESDLWSLAFGEAVDRVLLVYSFSSKTRKAHPKYTYSFEEIVKEGITAFEAKYGPLSAKERRELREELLKILECWHNSPLAKLTRPRTHVIFLVKGGEVRGVFAQPDFYDREKRVFYEVKSFDIEKEPCEYVFVQAKVFALLGELVLVYFARKNSSFELKLTKVERDLAVIDDLWEFLGKKLAGSYYEVADLVTRNPYVIWKWRDEKSKWEYMGFWRFTNIGLVKAGIM